MVIFLIARLSSSLRTRSQLGFLRHHGSHISYSFSSVAQLSQSNGPKQDRDGDHSFTAFYLVNSCGMSAKVAGKVSKRIELKDLDQPNSVINLLRSYGFSDPQISKIVVCCPRLLMANPEHNLLPRLRFMQSIGFSADEIPELFSYNPSLLFYSLEKRIIPHYEALRSVLDDDWKVRKCLRCSTWSICSYDVKNIVPNIKVLRDVGVPQSSVFSLICRRANLVFMNQSMFGEYVKFVKETGIEPFKFAFGEALIIVTQMNKSTWESKLDMFEKLGWSRDVTLSAFRRFPRVMALSEKNIANTIKFFVDEMGLQLEDIARSPSILSFSLKLRIIPRWSVVKILKSMGLVKDNTSPISIIIANEQKFLESFVIKFQESVPQLLKLYRGELGPLPEVHA